MTLEHVAIWTDKLEALKDYYSKYFDATPNDKYTNNKKQFQSYFLTFKSGARLKIMTMPNIPKNLNDTVLKQHIGIIHLAFGVDTKQEVEEKAKQLKEDGFVILSGQPANMFVVALEDCVALQINFEDEQNLKALNPTFQIFFRIMAERSTAFMQRRIITNLTKSAEKRYDLFQEQYPKMSFRFPQYMVASYLGMTTQFLSKIRNQN